jgi:ribosomal protein L30E
MFRLKRITLQEELETEADLGYIPVGTFQISNIERENFFKNLHFVQFLLLYIA